MNKNLNLNKNQKLIAQKRYLKRDAEGEIIETVEEMFRRISKRIASAEKKYNTAKDKIEELEEKFFKIQSNFEFISGIPLNDQDRNKLMGDCYVLPLDDSLEAIYKTLYQSVQLHRLGAGIGYDFSVIRPEGSLVHSTQKEASGPISFMRLFDFSSEIILNRGSTRHAGHMGILRIDHPDIEKFISAKEDYSQLTNFNLSVAITDEFIKAFKNKTTYKLVNPTDQTVVKEFDAHDILTKIATSMHKSGEPGVIFIDEINRKHPLNRKFTITATNLCGEQPLLPYESCNLGSVVLSNFVNTTDSNKPDKAIDWKRLEEVVRLGVRFLDNTLDLAHYALDESRQIVTEENRKIGLGLMAWADLLAILKIPYDSKEAIKLASKVMLFITSKARDESAKLGKEKGNFENFKYSVFIEEGFKNMRNATVTTLAPNGTISLFSDCNGGIEPFFALSYIRKNMETLGKKELFYENKYLKEDLKEEWIYSKELMKQIAKNGGNLQNLEEIPKNIKAIYKTSYDISPQDHIKMQAAFQKHTDNAVSKTVNLSEDTTIKEIRKLIVNAYDLKLKGLTVYRDKSRSSQVLSTEEKS